MPRRLVCIALSALLALPGSASLFGEDQAPPKKDAAAATETKKSENPKKTDDPKKTDEKKDAKDKKKDAKTDQEIVVSAAKLPTPRERTGVSVTRISQKDLELSQENNVGESLRMVPGATINQSGRTGDFTQLRIRGGETDHALVMWDGFKVNSSGLVRQYNFNSLDPIGADRLEIARGPGSMLNGSDAVTGSVNVLSKKGEGKPHLTASAAGGTFGTDREIVAIEGSVDFLSYNVAASHQHRSGAEVKNSGFTTDNEAARFDFLAAKDHVVRLFVRRAAIEKGWYESTASGYGTAIDPADPNDDIDSTNELIGLEYAGRPVPIWETILRPGYFQSRVVSISKAFNPDSPMNAALDPFGFSGPANKQPNRSDTLDTRRSMEWRNNITAYEDKHFKDTITAGYYAEKETFRNTETGFTVNFPPPFFIPQIDFRKDRDRFSSVNQAAFIQNRLEIYDRVFLTAGGRREDNENFGVNYTAHGDGSILIPESGTRLFGSAGTAFRAPAFSELFGPFGGNPQLLPERNFGWDAGIEQHFLKRRITIGATYFSNNFTNLIVNKFNTVTGVFSFENLDTATTRGWELFARFEPVKQVTLEGTATLLKAKDGETGKRLLRRPGETYTARVVAHPLVDLVPKDYQGLDISFEFLSVSNRRDVGSLVPASQLAPFDFDSAFAHVKATGYQRFDLAVSYRFWKDRLRAFGRFSNFTNAKYEDVATFPADGASFLGGLEFSWRF